MVATGKASAALAKIGRDREAIAAQSAALNVQEKDVRKAIAPEGISTLVAAFAKIDLGEVSKIDAARFAKYVQRLGLAESLVRLETK